MPVAIQMPRERKDAVERLGGLLSLVGGVKKTFFDGPTDEEKEMSALQRKKAKLDTEEAERRNQNIISDEKLLSFGSNYDQQTQAGPGTIELKRIKDGQVVPVYLKPRATLGLDELIKKQNLKKGELDIEKTKQEIAEGPAPKPNQSLAAGFANRADSADKIIDSLKSVPSSESVFGIPTYEIQNSGLFPERAKTQNVKQFQQAANDFVSSVLRKESGAAISEEEYKREAAKYLPAPGDSEEILAQKAAARANARASLRAEAGENALRRVQKAKPMGDVPEHVKQAARQEIARRKGLSSVVRKK